MTWAEFITQISSAPEVTLVGPLLDKPHSPLGPTVYVDGGSRFRSADRTHVFPSVSVGDGDSSTSALDVMLPAAKDYSDLAFVLRELPPSVTRMELVGFLGGRQDHHLANLGEIYRCLSRRDQFTSLRMIKDNNAYILAFGRGQVLLTLHGAFSVFVLELAQIRISGECRYPLSLDTTLYPFSSHGLSNEGFGRVQIESVKPCFVCVNI
ncbi:MAG: hypothetical protein AB7G93_12390 [Bdellovibrionales bacterium]